MDCIATVCPCLGIKKSIKLRLKKNLFEKYKNEVVRGFSTQEGRCEMIGFKVCEYIDSKQTTLSQVVDDIVQFSRIYSEDTKGVQLAWLSLHLALGILYHYKTMDRPTVRKILTEMLVHSRGIDLGLFMRDVMHYEDLTIEGNEAVDKSLYVIQFCSGMTVNLNDPSVKDRIIVGPSKVEYRDLLEKGTCSYFDLPTGHPTLTMSANVNIPVTKTLLHTACENLQPHVVKCLLQHGADPSGKPIESLINCLNAHRIITGVVSQTFGDQPMEIIQECLKLCLRAVPTLHVNHTGETIADLEKKGKLVYYLSEKAAAYMPDHMYKSPAPLKHLCRCAIRQQLLKSDHIPKGITQLPRVTPELQSYLQLCC